MAMNNGTYLLDVYHGSDLTTVKSIVSSKTFTVGEARPDHWLGQGAYFFREDMDQAYMWAISKIDRLKMEDSPSVINVKLTVNDKNFLIINSRAGMKYFKEFIKSKEHIIKEHKIKLVSGSKYLRCYLCNLLPEEIKVIQGIFYQDSKFDDNDFIKDSEIKLAGIQICVRDVSIINNKDMTIVKTGAPRGRKRNLKWKM